MVKPKGDDLDLTQKPKKGRKSKSKVKEAPKEPPRITDEEDTYGEPTPNEVPTPEVPAASPGPSDGYTGDALRMKEFLDSQPKVLMYVPLDDGENPKNAYRTVTMNGYKYTIKKGVQVEIPKPVAELLAESLGIQDLQAQDKRLDLNNEKRDALS